MTTEEFKAHFLTAITEDDDFAKKALAGLAEHCALTLKDDWRSPGYFCLTLSLGDYRLEDFITLPFPRNDLMGSDY